MILKFLRFCTSGTIILLGPNNSFVLIVSCCLVNELHVSLFIEKRFTRYHHFHSIFIETEVYLALKLIKNLLEIFVGTKSVQSFKNFEFLTHISNDSVSMIKITQITLPPPWFKLIIIITKHIGQS